MAVPYRIGWLRRLILSAQFLAYSRLRARAAAEDQMDSLRLTPEQRARVVKFVRAALDRLTKQGRVTLWYDVPRGMTLPQYKAWRADRLDWVDGFVRRQVVEFLRRPS